VTVSALACLVVAAGAIGVHLGQAAIDDINPLYFQGAAVHPRDRGAEVSELSLQPQPATFAQLYGWEQGQAARTADCGNCAALGARDAYGGTVQFAVIQGGWRTEARPAVYAPAEPAEAATPEAEDAQPQIVIASADVARYANYPIEVQQQAPAAEQAEAAVPAAETVTEQ
jgi:hypothetical protein